MKSIVRIVLLIFVVGSVSYLVVKWYGFDAFQDDKTPPPASTAVATTASPQAAEDASEGVVLYYFHGYRRCYTCRTIEKYLAEVVDTFFPEEIAAGALEWRPVNIEEPQNKHFTRDFGLVSSSAVIAEMKGGVVERSKNLDLVWELVRDKPAFMEYVKSETEGFIGKGGRR